MSLRLQNGKWRKKRIIHKRSMDDRSGINSCNYDMTPDFEDCNKLLEKWRDIIKEFCDDSDVPQTRDLDPADDLQQFLISIGIQEDQSNISKYSAQQIETQNNNNNRKNDNNNNDCDKDVIGKGSNERKSTDNRQDHTDGRANGNSKEDGDLFKNSIVISASKMKKLKDTLIESERAIRKIIELKRPEPPNFYEEETPFGHYKTEFVQQKYTPIEDKSFEKCQSNSNQSSSVEVTTRYETFNNNHSNYNVQLKSQKCDEINKSSINEIKQTFKRPTDEAELEISIGRNKHDDNDDDDDDHDNDDDRIKCFKTRIPHYETSIGDLADNRINTKVDRNRKDKLRRNNNPRGDFNISNCCNARNNASSQYIECNKQTKCKQYNLRHTNHNVNVDYIIAGKTQGKPSDVNKSIINTKPEDQYILSDSCPECCRNCERDSNEITIEKRRKAKVRHKKSVELKSIGTTMNTDVHIDCVYDPYVINDDHKTYDGMILNCDQCKYKITSNYCNHCNAYTRNFSQNYDYCSEGRCCERFPCIYDNEFLNNENNGNKLFASNCKIEKSIQTDWISTEYDSSISYQSDYNNNNKHLVKDSTKRSTDPTMTDFFIKTSSQKRETKTSGDQTDIIDLINEVTSDINQNISTNNPDAPTNHCHIAGDRSNKNIGINDTKRESKHTRPIGDDDIYNSGRRIVKAIEDELKDIEPYLTRSNGSIVLRLASREINKISDFLNSTESMSRH